MPKEGIEQNKLDIEALYWETIAKGFAVKHNALSRALLLELQNFAKTVPLNIHNVSENVILKLNKLQHILQQKIHFDGKDIIVNPDIAVVQYYDKNKIYPTYGFHRDAPAFLGISSLLSFTSEATFEIEDKKIECKPNTLITLLGNNYGSFSNEMPSHLVSPPKSDEGRYMLFLGMKAR